MANGIVLDCKCEGSRRLNEMKQVAADVRKMESPKVLRIVQDRPTQTYRNNKREGDEFKDDIETGFVYHFGGRITHQCVDARDVQRLLERRLGKKVTFVVEKNHVQPAPVNEAVDTTSTLRTDPFGGSNTINPDTVDPDADLTDDELVAQLEAIDGIGNKTATSLVKAGYSVSKLGQIDINDAVTIATIADKIDTPAVMVAKAISGSQVVEVEDVS